MNRALSTINLIGVLIVAGLCVYQWRINSAAHQEISRLEKLRDEQAAGLAEKQKAIDGQITDLEFFRSHLSAAKVSQKEIEDRFRLAEAAVGQLAAERDQLKSSVAEWSGAVALRDKRLEEAAAQINNLVTDRDAAISKFNELAERQNALVQRHNELVDEINKRNAAAATNKPTARAN